MKSTPCARGRFITTVGRAYLLEALYGSKYAPHIGTYNMPFLYVKTILMCASAYGLEKRESRYLHGLIECLLPSNASQDNLTKLELLQFVDAIPARDNTEWMAAEEKSMTALTSSSSLTSSTESAALADDALRTRAADASFAPPVPDRVAPDAFSFLSSSTFPSSLARLLVYDAVAACVADSLYSASERDRVALVASQVGLSAAEREHIERTALQERALSVRKRRLLCLDDAPMRQRQEKATSDVTTATSLREGVAGEAHTDNTSTTASTVSIPMDVDCEDADIIDVAPDDSRHTQRAETRAYVYGHDSPAAFTTRASASSRSLPDKSDQTSSGGSGRRTSTSARTQVRQASHHRAMTETSAPFPMSREQALRILRQRAAVSANEDDERG